MALIAATGTSENIEDARDAAREIMEQVSKKAQLAKNKVGILFCSHKFDLEVLISALKERLDAPIFGCTTWSSATEDGHLEESASLLVLSGDDLEIGIGLGENLAAEPERAVKAAMAEARKGLRNPPRLAIALPDTALSGSPAEPVVNALRQALDAPIPLIGALPGDGGQFKKAFQFANGKVVSGGLPILLLSGDIEAVVATRSGWKPLGEMCTATKAERNVLLEVDGRPAVEYLKRYIADVDNPVTFGTYPIALYEDASVEDEYVIRSPFFYDKATGGVTYAGIIPQGGKVKLARGSRDDIVAGAGSAAKRVGELLGGKDPACLLYFSCGGRKAVLGLEIGNELATLQATLGEKIPINGFYAYGEIGPLNGTTSRPDVSRFHNTTIVLCGLRATR